MIISFAAYLLLASAGSAAPSDPAPHNAPTPAIFSRAQLKYGLERDNYLSRWVDRPLLLDPGLQKEDDKSSINAASLRIMKETAMKYGLNGFAFFPEISRTRQIYSLVANERPEGFLLLSEFGSRGKEGDQLAIAKAALNSPASFRLDGKVVFTSYGADQLPPAHWSALMAKIRAAHGDHFVFLPAIVRFGGEPPAYWNQRFHDGVIDRTDEERVKESLREWLRHTDGLYFASTAGIKRKRLFDPDFYSDFIIRMMRETLSEPEFRGKYFGLSANIGHENCTRFGYTQSSEGTLTLRQSLERAIAARPHLINIPEWDEQNENTSLRPTVYNGYSSMRILRHYTSALKGELQSPLPQDNLELPNLVVSYRKCLVLGEKLELELLNVPDTEAKGEYEIRFTLSGLKGGQIYASESFTVDATSLNEKRITIPTEVFEGQRTLIPSLAIIRGDERLMIADGLQPIDLRSTENWDYKWVKQPIRDLLSPGEFTFTVDEPDSSGIRRADVSISAQEPLRYVELLDGDDVVYSYSESPEIWRENDTEVVISLYWQAAKLMSLDGKIGLIHGGAARWKVPSELPSSVLEGHTLHLNRVRTNHWPRRILVAIPRSELARAAFEIEMGWGEKQTLPISDLLALSTYGVSGPHSFNLIFSRYVRQDVIPRPLMKSQVNFTVPVLPDRRDSLLLVQAQGMSGRIFRSRPIMAGAAPERSETVVWSAVGEKPVKVTTSVPDLNYHFNSAHGSVLTTDAGRPFFGILGGYSQQVTERGGGESADGTPFIRRSDYPANASQSAPVWERTAEGREVLRFDGKGTYVTLPQGAIPRLSGFAIDMEVRPEHVRGRQILMANRSYYPGSLTLLIDKGILKARFSGESEASPLYNSRLSVKAGEWSRIQVFCDQAHLWFQVNGEVSERFPISCPGMYDTVTAIGGFGNEWFAGALASLRIHHAPFLP